MVTLQNFISAVALFFLVHLTAKTSGKAKTLEELDPDELAGLTSAGTNDFSDAVEHGCGMIHSREESGNHNHNHRADIGIGGNSQSASVFQLFGCSHCPIDGPCDNPEIRDVYQNRSDPLHVDITWHVLPGRDGSAVVNMSHLASAGSRVETAFQDLRLNLTSRFVVSPYRGNYSDLAKARVATHQHPGNRFPFCESPADPHNIHLHLAEVDLPGTFTVLTFTDRRTSFSSSQIPYGTQMRAGDLFLYSFSPSNAQIEAVLYRFDNRRSFHLESTPSGAVSRTVLPLGSGVIERNITEDGDYFVWVYNRSPDGSPVKFQYFVSFEKANCFSQDEFMSRFEPLLEPDSLNVVVMPQDVFQGVYFNVGATMLYGIVDGFAYFPFGSSKPWQVGLSVVAHPAVINPSWSVLQHEVGHVLGLWHPSHGVTETVDCKTQEDNKPCSPDQFRCTRVTQCFSTAAFCDGRIDCFDGTDEPSNCQPLCYQPCENPCRESNDFTAYRRDRVGDFCEDTEAEFTRGSPVCSSLTTNALSQSQNLMSSTNRATVVDLTRDQLARARCWLLNNPHQEFVPCRKWVKVNYTGYVDQCTSGFVDTTTLNGSVAIPCDVDPCQYVNPCRNGGRCVGGYDTVSCKCNGTGFSGPFCRMKNGTIVNPTDSSFEETTDSLLLATTDTPIFETTTESVILLGTTEPPLDTTTDSFIDPTTDGLIEDSTTSAPFETTTDSFILGTTEPPSLPDSKPTSPSSGGSSGGIGKTTAFPCSVTERGCCPDGVTAAGPYRLDCPGVDARDVWNDVVADYAAEFKKWKANECSAGS